MKNNLALCGFWTGITAVVCWASGASLLYLIGGAFLITASYFTLPENKTQDCTDMKSYPGWETEKVF